MRSNKENFLENIFVFWGQKSIPEQDTKPIKENQAVLHKNLKLLYEKRHYKDNERIKDELREKYL